MVTFLLILAVALPIVSFLIVPSWMKKRGYGKDNKRRKICGIGSAIILFFVMCFVASPFIDDSAEITTDSSTEVKEQSEPLSPNYEQVGYYKRDKKGDNNYRIFVFVTDASPRQMEKHARKQMWSSKGTTMVCYFRNADDVNGDAITMAKDVDSAIDQIWKPSLVARYMHWPTGKEEFTEDPYVQ